MMMLIKWCYVLNTYVFVYRYCGYRFSTVRRLHLAVIASGVTTPTAAGAPLSLSTSPLLTLYSLLHFTSFGYFFLKRQEFHFSR